MAIDDHPIDALRKRFEIEDSLDSPVVRRVAESMGSIPLERIPVAGDFLRRLREAITAHHKRDNAERVDLMMETYGEEIKKLDEKLGEVENLRSRIDELADLVVDGARKAEATRAKERIKRIGTILANATVAAASTDSVEEMMRIAMNLGDEDVAVLRELVRIEGDQLRKNGRLDRYNAHQLWEHARWNFSVESELVGVCSKLESYGLLERLAPPNNQNILADIESRFKLLHKGLRFSDFIKSNV